MQAASAPHAPAVRRADDPLGAVGRLDRDSTLALAVGIGLALVIHVCALTVPFFTLLSMRRYVEDLRAALHAHFGTEYEVDVVDEPEDEPEEEVEIPVEEPEPEIEEPAPPEPEEAPPPDNEPPPDDSPYPDEEPAPTPAEAPDVLTSDEPVDLTGEQWGMVDKDGSKTTGGGYTSAKGTSKTPVRNRHARNDGRPGGRGTGKAAPRPRVDRSRPATPVSTNWNCPFPPQADLEQIDRAAVVLSVMVAPDGSPRSVRILSDPGYGFGQMAKRCAMTQRYNPAFDNGGKAIVQTSPPFRINFTR